MEYQSVGVGLRASQGEKTFLSMVRMFRKKARRFRACGMTDGDIRFRFMLLGVDPPGTCSRMLIIHVGKTFQAGVNLLEAPEDNPP